jgi:hypothetical protein
MATTRVLRALASAVIALGFAVVVAGVALAPWRASLAVVALAAAWAIGALIRPGHKKRPAAFPASR